MSASLKYMRRPLSKAPRALLPDDRHKIHRELNLRCQTGSFVALRLRAVVSLAACSALRLYEIASLDTEQLIDVPVRLAPRGKDGKIETGRWTVRSQGYVRADQAKGCAKGPHLWTSAGRFLIADETRSAIRAYVEVARRWLHWPPRPGDPLFVAVRSNRHAPPADGPRNRASRRVIQHDWAELQVHAGIVHPYHFHCLRHDAMTRMTEVTNGNTRKVAEFGRCDILTAEKYSHIPPGEMDRLRNELSFSR